MNALPPHLRSLLDAAQEAHDPSDADRERVFVALTATLGTAGVAGALGAASHAGASTLLKASTASTTSLSPAPLVAASATATATTSAGLGLGAKVLLAVGLSVGGASLWPVLSAPRAEKPTPALESHALEVAEAKPAVQAAAPSSEGAVQAAPATHRSTEGEPTLERADVASSLAADAAPAATAPSAAEPAGLTREEVESLDLPARATATRTSSARTTTSRSREAANAVSSASPEAPAAPAASSTQAELTLLRRTLTALRDQDPRTALTLLEEHAARFPNGSMQRERLGLRVVALCAAGQVELGRKEQVSYLQKDASSALAKRVRAACSGDAR